MTVPLITELAGTAVANRRVWALTLLSMECLAGAAYTRAVQAAGLTGAPRPSLGRVDADFADWRIGVCSRHAQLWIDRNFALDYTLKSLEKILDEQPRRLLHPTRPAWLSRTPARQARQRDGAARCH